MRWEIWSREAGCRRLASCNGAGIFWTPLPQLPPWPNTASKNSEAWRNSQRSLPVASGGRPRKQDVVVGEGKRLIGGIFSPADLGISEKKERQT